MGLTGRAVVSRMSEVTNLPLLKIFAKIDFSRGEFVLPPTVYEWGNGGGERGLWDELESNVFCRPHLAPTVSEWGERWFVSCLSEVTNLPLFRAVEIGPIGCACQG